MNPTIHHDILKARICDLHHQAQRDALTLAVRRARRAQRDQSKYPAPAFPIVARRMLTVLRARST